MEAQRVAMTLKFKLGRDLCTMHLPTKFHHPMFIRSEVIVLTNKQTDKQTNKKMLLKASTLLHHALPVDNNNNGNIVGY